jgi:hypothetical protein
MDTVIYTSECVVTGKKYSVTIPREAHAKWQAGASIQSALHMIPPADREFILSGISPEGWDATFGSNMDGSDPEASTQTGGEA